MTDQSKRLLLLMATLMQIEKAIPIAENRNPAMYFPVWRQESTAYLSSTGAENVAD